MPRRRNSINPPARRRRRSVRAIRDDIQGLLARIDNILAGVYNNNNNNNNNNHHHHHHHNNNNNNNVMNILPSYTLNLTTYGNANNKNHYLFDHLINSNVPHNLPIGTKKYNPLIKHYDVITLDEYTIEEYIKENKNNIVMIYKDHPIFTSKDTIRNTFTQYLFNKCTEDRRYDTRDTNLYYSTKGIDAVEYFIKIHDIIRIIKNLNVSQVFNLVESGTLPAVYGSRLNFYSSLHCNNNNGGKVFTVEIAEPKLPSPKKKTPTPSPSSVSSRSSTPKTNAKKGSSKKSSPRTNVTRKKTTGWNKRKDGRLIDSDEEYSSDDGLYDTDDERHQSKRSRRLLKK